MTTASPNMVRLPLRSRVLQIGALMCAWPFMVAFFALTMACTVSVGIASAIGDVWRARQ